MSSGQSVVVALDALDEILGQSYLIISGSWAQQCEKLLHEAVQISEGIQRLTP